jgi:hypothetical protein
MATGSPATEDIQGVLATVIALQRCVPTRMAVLAARVLENGAHDLERSEALRRARGKGIGRRRHGRRSAAHKREQPDERGDALHPSTSELDTQSAICRPMTSAWSSWTK